jgi:hypothetical protein
MSRTSAKSAAAGAPAQSKHPDAAWLQRYGQHLGRLYEPSASLPPELDSLVRSLADRLASAGNRSS